MTLQYQVALARRKKKHLHLWSVLVPVLLLHPALVVEVPLPMHTWLVSGVGKIKATATCAVFLHMQGKAREVAASNELAGLTC